MGEGQGSPRPVTYHLVFRPSAIRDLTKLPADMRQQVAERMDALTGEPRPPGTEQLRGKLKGMWRIRVRDYRVGYEVDDGALIVTVRAIGHRRGFYELALRRGL